MSRNIGLQLVAYSLLLASLSYLTHRLAPTLAQLTVITGLTGGALCLVCGLRAVMGKRDKALVILTLIPVNYVMLSQTVMTWGGGSQPVPGQQTAALVIMTLSVCSVGMLMRIAWAGMGSGGQPASDSTAGGSSPQSTRKIDAPANATKRA
jgi:hypothetical protein